MVTGVIAFGIDATIERVGSYKYAAIKYVMDVKAYMISGLLTWIGINISFVLIASYLAAYVEVSVFCLFYAMLSWLQVKFGDYNFFMVITFSQFNL